MKNKILDFFKNESASGLILIICAIIAMIIANSSFATSYENMLKAHITIGYKDISISMSILHWINDGLMAVFFFVVGMEIKKELVIGDLRSFKKTILPISAAIGGIVVPAIIYVLFNYQELTIKGWGIPMATDIAFALGILSLVGKKAPKGIAVFLTALAIVDDLGAIMIIAIFYTSQISWSALIIGLIILAILILISKFEVKSKAVFIIGGIFLWICFLKSGIHATVAGVLLGLILPIEKNADEFEKSILYKFEHALNPWSAFVIMPIFALANSGINIDVNSFKTLVLSPVSLGIMFGLFIGKQVGIYGVSYILVKMKVAKLPDEVTNIHLYGASVLGGIGFTMSLFIASLSFSDKIALSSAKISIMIASIISALMGAIIFKFANTQVNTSIEK